MDAHWRYMIDQIQNTKNELIAERYGYVTKKNGVQLREIFDEEENGPTNRRLLIVADNSADEWETENDSYISSEDDIECDSLIDRFESRTLRIIGKNKWRNVYGCKVDLILTILVRLVALCSRCLGKCINYLIPSVTSANFAVLVAAVSVAAPAMISNYVIYPCCRLVFGTLYPAYASYKAVRTKNVKEYVKWMMYWIVFAFFTCFETFTDVFLSWFPFYYEVKVLMVIWLLSPATKGSSILYRKFVHPALCRREQEIDEYISKAKDQGYHTVLNLGQKGVNYATNVIMQTAIKGGGGLVQQLRKSYSLSDLTITDDRSDQSQQELDEVDDMVSLGRVVRRSTQGRTSREVRGPRTMSAPRVDMIFSEVDMDRHSGRSSNSRDSVNLSHIRSSEDISGPYPPEKSSSQDTLMRTASVGGASTRTRSKVVRSTFTSIKRPGAAEGEDLLIEECEEDNSLPIPLENLSPLFSDGSLCVPNSNDMLMLYLRQLVEDDLRRKQLANEECKLNDPKNLNEMVVPEIKTAEKNDKVNHEEDIKQKNDKSKIETKLQDQQEKLVDGEDDKVGLELEIKVPEDSNPNIKTEDPITVEEKVASIKVEESKKESVKDIIPILKVEENPFSDASSIKSTKSNEENASVSGFSSAISSDDEFATPDSSPKLKVKKLAKHKKRQAPPPPQIKYSDDSKVDNKTVKPNEDDKSMNIEKLDDEPKISSEKKSEHIQDKGIEIIDNAKFSPKVKSKVIENVEEIIDKDNSLSKVNPDEITVDKISAEKIASPSSKSNTKSPSTLSKLMHLPSRLSFWGSSEEVQKKTSNAPKHESNDPIPIVPTNPIDTTEKRQSEKNIVKDIPLKDPKVNKDEDVFHDAKDITTNPTVEIKEDNSETSNISKPNDLINNTVQSDVDRRSHDSDFTFIPLSVAALSVNTESRSTDV